MHIDVRGIKALQQLRIDLQESAGREFPNAQLRELLILYDVCKYLEIPLFSAQEVLGTNGYDLVTSYINQPLTAVNGQAIQRILNAS